LLAVLEIALIYYCMGNIAITGCATVLALQTDFVEHVAGVAVVSDGNA
jgi:hypothetical protein